MRKSQEQSRAGKAKQDAKENEEEQARRERQTREQNNHVTSLEEKVQSLQSALSASQDEMSKVVHELDKVKTDNAVLRKQELDKAKADTISQMQQLKAQADKQVQAIREKADVEAERLKAELQKKQASQKLFEEQLDNRDCELAKLEEQCEALKNQLKNQGHDEGEMQAAAQAAPQEPESTRNVEDSEPGMDVDLVLLKQLNGNREEIKALKENVSLMTYQLEIAKKEAQIWKDEMTAMADENKVLSPMRTRGR